MKRNLEIEQRIEKNIKFNIQHKVNLYGGMGMDGISIEEKRKRLQELDYIQKHPELYSKTKNRI